MKKYLTILCLFVILTSTLNAQTIVTDRPDQTESSSTIPFNSFQIESGLTMIHLGGRAENIKILALPSTLFRYGLTSGIELRVFSQFEQIETNRDSLRTNTTGFSNLAIGAKLQILKKENINTEIAFLTHLLFPSGSYDFTDGKYATENKLAISHSLGEKHSIGYNIGYNYYGQGNGVGVYSIAFGFGITKKLGLYAEPFGQWIEFENFEHHFNCGAVYLIQDNLQVDFAIGAGINNTLNFYTFGFSWNISE